MKRHGKNKPINSEPENNESDPATFGYIFSPIETKTIKNETGVINALAWNRFAFKEGLYIFATAGENRVAVYEIKPNDQNKLHLVVTFEAQNDKFYSICWSGSTIENDESSTEHFSRNIPPKGTPILIFGGELGIIRIVSLYSGEEFATLKTHCGAINHLRIHPAKPRILLSASKDFTLRLWNLHTHTLFAIFIDQDQVMSAEFHYKLPLIVSCGGDWKVKIWSSENKDNKNKDKMIEKKFEESQIYERSSATRLFEPITVYEPIYSTYLVHSNFVDSVLFFRNTLIISKSIQEKLMIWRPCFTEKTLEEIPNIGPGFVLAKQLFLSKSSIRFLKMGMSKDMNLLACGNDQGEIHLFNFDVPDIKSIKNLTLRDTSSNLPIRHVDFSLDTRFMVCVGDGNNVIVYEVTKNKENTSAVSSISLQG